MRLLIRVTKRLFLLWLLLPLACIRAQQAIQVKADVLLRYQDYYASSPSGPEQNGDTYYWTGHAVNAAGMPVPGGLPIVGTWNDGRGAGCPDNSNMGILQLDTFSWLMPALTHMSTINCMLEFGIGGAEDTPTGWNHYCSGQSGYNACGWKSGNPYYKNGKLFLPAQRQVNTGTNDPPHDATVNLSPDDGKHWCNPWTMAQHDGECAAPWWSANGDAPKPLGDPSYPGNIIWQALPPSYWSAHVIHYGQDGSYPTDVEPYCAPQVYTCFLFANGVLAQWTNVTMERLDKSGLRYYIGIVTPGSVPDPNNPANWSTTVPEGRPVARFYYDTSGGLSTGDEISMGTIFSVARLEPFKSYVATGYSIQPGGRYALAIATAPHPAGPWTVSFVSKSFFTGFATINPSIAYSVVSTNPPEVLVTVSGNNNVHHPSHTPYWLQIALTAGPAYAEGAHVRNETGSFTQNSGWRFSAGKMAGSLLRRNLVYAFDFRDTGENVLTSPHPYFQDVGNKAAVLHKTGGVLIPEGVRIANSGDLSGIYLRTSQVNGAPLLNVPPALQGNPTFTSIGVFRLDLVGYPYAPFWVIGDPSVGNASVGLYWTGSAVGLRWGSRFQLTHLATSSFTPVGGNWYFYATTVEANGANPIYHLWVGIGGTLVDVLAGVGRVTNGGNPDPVPAIPSGSSIVLANDSFVPETIDGSFAAWLLYTGIMPKDDISWTYAQLQYLLLSERGIIVQ